MLRDLFPFLIIGAVLWYGKSLGDKNEKPKDNTIQKYTAATPYHRLPKEEQLRRDRERLKYLNQPNECEDKISDKECEEIIEDLREQIEYESML